MAKYKYGKNKQGLFETSKTYDGKRVKFRGKTCAAVDQKIREYEEGKKKGRKVSEVADEWLATQERKISASTYRVYGYGVNRIKDYFKDQYIGQIRPLDLDRFVLSVEAQGYARNTVNLQVTVLKQMFAYAVKKSGDIDVSPAREISPSKGLPQKKRTALTEEQERAIEVFRGDNWLFGLMLLYTGLRRGELLALNWQDIDRKAGVIHVTKKINYTGNVPKLETHLKNCDARDVPLFSVLEQELPKNRLGKIFANENGDYLSQNQLQKLWKKYSEDVGLEGITPHCLRHSFSTICFEAGIDPKDAAAFLGDTEEVTRAVYTDLRKRHRESSAERVNAYLEMRRKEGEKAQA